MDILLSSCRICFSIKSVRVDIAMVYILQEAVYINGDYCIMCIMYLQIEFKEEVVEEAIVYNIGVFCIMMYLV